MKKTIFALLCAGILFAGVGVSATAQDTKTVKFNVSMTCESCVTKIKENISYEKGVKDLNVSLDNKTVEVTYDPTKTDEKTLSEALTKLGYTVTPAADKTLIKDSKVKPSSEKAATDGTKSTESAGDKIKGAANTVGEKTKETANTVGEKTKETANTVGDKTKETANTVGDKTKETANTVGEKTKETANTVGEKTKETANKVGDFFKKDKTE